MATTRATTSSLLRRHAPLWKVTCRNPFVLGLRDGSQPDDVFDRWLVEHGHLADGVFPAYCRMAAAAPSGDRKILLEAVRNLFNYISWLGPTLQARGLDRDAPPHPVCRAYVDFMLALGFEPYPVALVALWTQYRAHDDAWKFTRPAASRFRGIVRDLGNPVYGRCLVALARATDAALAQASPRYLRRAEEVFLEVAKYELAFWVMTMEPAAER